MDRNKVLVHLKETRLALHFTFILLLKYNHAFKTNCASSYINFGFA